MFKYLTKFRQKITEADKIKYKESPNRLIYT